MRISGRHAWALFCLLAPLGTRAQTARTVFSAKQIFINGAGSVYVSAMDARGDIAGNYISFVAAYSFVRTRSLKVMSVPAPPGCGAGGQTTMLCLPFPTAINDAGLVAGYWTNFAGNAAYQTSLFTWQLGAPALAATYLENTSEAPLLYPQPYMNGSGTLAFNSVPPAGDTNVVEEGPIGNPAALAGLDATASVTGINNNGVLVGRMQAVVNGTAQYVGFIADHGTVTTVSPPGSASVVSAVINNRREVAGTYLDSQAITHGFTYHDGKFRNFGPAVYGATLTVTGINNKGRVVGISGVDPFLFNGTSFTLINNSKFFKPIGLFTNVLINDVGFIVYSNFYSYQESFSYFILCHGPGC